MLAPWKRSYDQPKQHIKKKRHFFANKGPSSQSYVFSVVMYGYESWTIKKTECQRVDAYELWCWRKLLIIPWTARRSIQSILKEISPEYLLVLNIYSSIFIDVEAETPILWLLDVMNWLIGKDPDAGKGWRQEKKGMTQDEMVGWHHRLDGQEFE